MENQFNQHISKIIKIIKSCENTHQLLGAKRVINNFENFWLSKNPNVYLYVSRLQKLYKLKLNHIHDK
jgi:hypothetical protein